ncbi:MAG: YIP1 family protein [Chloroflexota bacterium]|nr:YIP1 family protein [Chloroflexota bacterium]
MSYDAPAAGTPGHREFDLSDPLRSFIDTTVRVVRQPTAFFEQLPRRAGYLNPTVYGVTCAVISALLGFAAYELLGVPPGGSIVGPTDVAGGTALWVLLDALALILVGLFLAAAVTHVAVRIVVGYENSGLEATFRVMAYSAALFLLDWLPYIGWVFAVYAFYVTLVGIREVHRTTTGKALGALLLPLLLFLPFLACFLLSLLADG